MVVIRLRVAFGKPAIISVDVPEGWTTQQLISCLEESRAVDASPSRSLQLYECWQRCERRLLPEDRPVQILQEWGNERGKVSFRVRDRPKQYMALCPSTAYRSKKFKLKTSARRRESISAHPKEIEATYNRIIGQQSQRMKRLQAELHRMERTLEEMKLRSESRKYEKEELHYLRGTYTKQKREMKRHEAVQDKVQEQKILNGEKAAEVVQLRKKSIAIRQDYVRTQEHSKSLQRSLELAQEQSAQEILQHPSSNETEQLQEERRVKDNEAEKLKGELVLRGKIHEFQNRKLRSTKDALIRKVRELHHLDDSVNKLAEQLSRKWKPSRQPRIKIISQSYSPEIQKKVNETTPVSRSPSLVPKQQPLPMRRKQRPQSMDLSHLSALSIDSSSSTQRRALSLILEPVSPPEEAKGKPYPSPSILPKRNKQVPPGPAVVFRRTDHSRGSGRWKRLSQRKRVGKEKTSSSTAKRGVSFEPLTILLSAAMEGDLNAVKEYTKQLGDPSKENNEGITALHNATYGSKVEVVQYLVDIGADINASDSEAWSPLHLAASIFNAELAMYLIQNGASVYAQTTDGDTPLEVAIDELNEDDFSEGKENDCIEIIREAQIHLGTKNEGLVYGLYSYEATEEDELPFQVNEELRVIRRGDEDEIEWWWIANENDEEGYAPRNYLSLYPRRFVEI
eukprot:m.38193 g.38193  ORF g.38193 m.38193 type:complete len:681 (+) comp32531_c0_seq2:17-2059(+)